MKKMMAILLAAILLLSLAACGGRDTPKPSGSADTPAISEDGAPEATQPAADDTSAPDAGQTEENDTSGNDESGLDESQFQWKDCSLTEAVPKPTAGVLNGSILMPGESQYIAKVMEITDEQADEYLNTVKDAGWSGEKSDQDGGFTFQSTHENGTQLELNYMRGLLTITAKPSD